MRAKCQNNSVQRLLKKIVNQNDCLKYFEERDNIMSKDIRSFFNVISKKNGDSSKPSKVSSKKPIAIIDSDDEDVVKQTPEKPKSSSKSSNKRKVQVISSDSEDEKPRRKPSPKKPKQKDEKLVPVNVDDYFKDEPVKMTWATTPPKESVFEEDVKNKLSKRTKNPELGVHGDKDFEKTLIELDKDKSKSKRRKKKSKNPELGVHGDKDFDKTLEELDDDDFINNLDVLDKTIEEATQKFDAKLGEKKPIESGSKPNSPIQKEVHIKNVPEVLKNEKKRQRNNSEGADSTPKKPKLDPNDSGIDPDQERHEKKRYSAMLYQKYLHRGGPKHHGQKELPKGKADCLKNLTFLRTGVLDSMEGDEFENLVKEHGGRVVHAVSRKVNYVIVGEDPGPSKLDKARGLNIPEIDEDQLLDLILSKSGMKPKYSKMQSEESCDSGLGKSSTSFEEPPEEKKIKIESEKKKEKNGKNDDTRKSKPNLKKLELLSANSSNNDVKTDLESKKEVKTYSSKKEEKPVIKEEDSAKQDDVPKKEEKHKPKSTDEKSKSKSGRDTKEYSKGKISSTDLQEKLPKQIPEENLSWADKYKPKDLKNVIGQQDGASNMNKLKKWLINWYRNQEPDMRKRIPKPSPWAKNDDGAYYKAALLSGPPGVGKTTTATLVSKELGFDVVEFNASDTRSKKLLHEEVSQLLSTTTIAGFATGQKTTTKKRVLLMDEVDGMAGNEDRGGIQELINLIKNTSIPIICMCNDRNHQKMRSLVNYCYDLRFNKPRAQQIVGAMMSICFKEGLKISPDALIEVINGTGCDIRQTLNHLSMWTSLEKNLSMETASKESKNAKKDTIMGPWEVVRAVFTPGEHDTVTDKFKLFFYDYSLGPLFVQENYLGVAPKCPKNEIMKRVSAAADAISMGDLIDSKIRSSNNWSLLETQALFSSVLPGHYMSGNITQRINFPGWLGKNSSASKRKRMLSELYTHTRTSTSGSKLAMNLDYLIPLRNAIINPLKTFGTQGVSEAIEVMKVYNLLREDLTNLIELCQWKDMKNPFNDIEPKVKSAFTRAYNKEGPLLPFAPTSGVSKKKAANADTELLDEEAYEDSDTEIEDDVGADAMIKVKTKTDSKAKKDSAKPSTSKAKDSSGKAKDQSKGGKGRSKKGK